MDKLGARLAAAGTPGDEDLAIFRQIAGHCQEVLGVVQAQLEELGYEGPTPRVKTTKTLIEKLQREHPMRLSQVQDLAGARVVVAGRAEQDQAVAAICRRFEEQGHACKIGDRLKEPMHGYRAIHVLTCIDQVNVEIQVRTELQDTWAQIIEDLGDTWGRGIRYGDEPLNPGALITIAGEVTVTRSQGLAVLKGLSEAIATVENGRALLRELGSLLEHWEPDALAGPVDPAELGRLREFPDRIERLAADPARHGQPPLHLPDGWRTATGEQAIEAVRRSIDWLQQMHDQQMESVRSSEQILRDTLQAVAQATSQEGTR